jgi:putative membrane protein
MLSIPVLVATLVYTAIGLFTFIGGFWLWDKISPVDMWGEICREKNVALAIFTGSIAIAIAMIIAAAIHG